jgi:secreted trypsin-like serine protease
MSRKIIVISITLLLLITFSTPAYAISYGQPDGNGHPSVGSIVARKGDQLYQICSGTLIAPMVYLTASHCTVILSGIQQEGYDILVTFDPTIDASSTFYTGTWYTNPAYLTANGQDDPGDVGVIILDQAPEGISPASLPSEGLLDQMKKNHTLTDTLFTAVGYGAVRDSNRTGFQGILDNLDRNKVDQEFLSLTDAWLTNSMNVATGNGGTCYGDSGGPHFIHVDGIETNIVASITVTGDAVCKATDKTYRMDTESVRSFLGQFVSLP